MAKHELKDYDWSTLSFSYVKTDTRYLAYYRDGKWAGNMTTDNVVHLHEGSTSIHYGQQCFEGLKAYRAKDGRILLFRPDENAKRMVRSAERIMLDIGTPEEFIEVFLKACHRVVRDNAGWVPPYGYDSTLYLRPFLLGVGENLGVRPAPETFFSVFGAPVGPYFKDGFKPVSFITSKYDRAAPYGTGAAKVGGNYAGSLMSGKIAKKQGFADCIYLDPETHTKIEEAGAANFFAITPDKKTMITPKSPSILPSITKYSLLHIAKEMLGLEVIEGDIPIDSLDKYDEAGACGTAAVITPIGRIVHNDKEYLFNGDGKEPGPITKKLYEILTKIQFGDIEGPDGWVVEVK